MSTDDLSSTAPPNSFSLPRRLRRLADLAYNLWWTWNSDADRAFRFLDPELWEATYHNPVRLLRSIDSQRLKAATQDRYYLDFYDNVINAYDAYIADRENTWYALQHPDRLNQPIAYFSTEFGLHETLPIYAGGLGVLSGDYLKEASDLGMPLVAIGFLYTQGYFVQRISEDGWQEANYHNLSFSDLPVHPVLNEDGEKITVSLDLPGREVSACLWRVQVGRVPLYLLDTNIESNLPSDRELSARLYTSDLELRISQEILLGLGGVRALRALGYNPAVWHMNEGHSAFSTIERARELTAAGRSFHDACEKVKASTVFTTHTSVPAGHDEFPLWLIDKYFQPYYSQLGLDRQEFIDLALNQQDWGDTFSMIVLALRMSEHRNGVSELHGNVARKMWSHLWPDQPVDAVPIQHITNGIQIKTWIARRLKDLYSLYFDPDWLERLDEPEIWEKIERVPDEELWEVRRHLKRKLVAYMRERVRLQWTPAQIQPVQVVASGVMLDPYALTIGFARRFATYKRANLLLRDPERLLRLINRPGMPVQVIFAGKAHPADEPGKRLIQEVYRQVKRPEFAGRLVFLEDYDVNLARYLIQGVDVWLNTPRRPNEASGTSGQKAAINGVLNFSVLDGWWREGYNGRNGWAIGEDQDHDNTEAQDIADAESFYQTLEEEIIPLYYERSADDLPSEWLGWAKESIRSLAPHFSMRRMVKEYISEMYLPALPELVGDK
ncbi:MAG: alpha-glucan family phosphorylase [Anaerolineaceae bacterium]|nr:MAG: alpha-glucan family phosphorylase [Anaerolineaceae bacterium]